MERWIAFVVDERKKNEKKTFESVLYADEGRGGGGELKRGASDKGSLYAYMIRTRTEPLLPEQIDSVLHVHRATLPFK